MTTSCCHRSVRPKRPAVLCLATLAGLLLLGLTGQAQVKQTHRYEVQQKFSSEYFTIVSMKDEGLAVFRETDKYDGHLRKWEFIALDTALRERYNLELKIEQRNTLLGFEYVPGFFYLLMRMGDSNKNKVELIEIEITKGEERMRAEIAPELDFKITHFNKVDRRIVLGGYVNNEPAVLLYNIDDKQIKVLPGFFQKDTELVDVRVNQNQTFNTLLIDRSTRTDRKLIFRTYDQTGNVLLETQAPIPENSTLQTSISSTLEREDFLVLGTWGERTGKQSSGFFSLPVDPFGEQKLQYTYFGELENFLGYLSPKRAKRIKEKTKESLQEGRRPDFSAYVIPFKITETPEGFLLLAEVYNPTSTNPYYGSPYYNNPGFYGPYSYSPYWPGYYPGMRMYRAPYMYGNNAKNTDEVKTYATAVIAFDPKGKILWDHSIKLEEIGSAALEQKGDFYYTGRELTLMYKKESELKIKHASRDSVNTREWVEKITTEDPQDEIRSEKEEEGGVSHWLGNTFYIWGYQTIRNNSKADRVRDVFYIRKVVVR
jgi:hypothetical protein